MRMRVYCIFLILCFLFPLQSSSSSIPINDYQGGEPIRNEMIAADPGFLVQAHSYLIVELQGAVIEPRGTLIANVLSNSGIVCSVVNVSEAISNSTVLTHTPAIIIDSSVGSNNGSYVPDSFITLLTFCDTPLVLFGRSAWILHRLMNIGPPTQTAPLHTVLRSTPDYDGAVFLTSPYSLSMDASVTSEEDLELPVESVQFNPTKIVNLTGSTNPAAHPTLRYTAWPSDVFLFGPEAPEMLNENGRNHLINLIAYTTSLKESNASSTIKAAQAVEGEILEGGLRYFHEPTLTSCYYAIKTMRSILNNSEWASWKSDYQTMIGDLLNTLIVDYGSESGFSDSVTEGTVMLSTTAHGLWIVAVMDLESQFSVSELSLYISSRQLSNGSFANRIDHTYYAIEAM